jgi:hypothetical protein
MAIRLTAITIRIWRARDPQWLNLKADVFLHVLGGISQRSLRLRAWEKPLTAEFAEKVRRERRDNLR